MPRAPGMAAVLSKTNDNTMRLRLTKNPMNKFKLSHHKGQQAENMKNSHYTHAPWENTKKKLQIKNLCTMIIMSSYLLKRKLPLCLAHQGR